MENAKTSEKTQKMTFAGCPTIRYNNCMQRVNILKATMAAVLALLTTGSYAEPAAPPPEVNAFSANTEVLDIPTASTMYGRMFNLNLRMFRGGGLLLKGTASAKDTFVFGFSLLANNVIGSGSITVPEDPKVLLKLRIINDTRNGLQAALGWDDSRYDATRGRGVYAVVSKELSVSSFYLTGHGGAGMTGLRDGYRTKDDLNLFAGLTGSFNEDFFLGVEFDDWLYTNKAAGIRNGSLNTLIGFAWDVSLKLEMGFKNLGRGSAYNRILKISYTF